MRRLASSGIFRSIEALMNLEAVGSSETLTENYILVFSQFCYILSALLDICPSLYHLTLVHALYWT
jgi:hypothetical protein